MKNYNYFLKCKIIVNNEVNVVFKSSRLLPFRWVLRSHHRSPPYQHRFPRFTRLCVVFVFFFVSLSGLCLLLTREQSGERLEWLQNGVRCVLAILVWGSAGAGCLCLGSTQRIVSNTERCLCMGISSRNCRVWTAPLQSQSKYLGHLHRVDYESLLLPSV